MSEAIHELARGFDLVGDEYERGRPGYSAQAIAFLVSELSLGPGRTALDLAAGTGKLTRQLLPSGADVIAVEPLAGMRAKLEEVVPGIRALAGTAEAIPLPDDSVDAVLVAQAFHWFDGTRAVPEIHRVLRPGGGLAALWNTRDESYEWVSELSRIIEQHGRGPFRRAPTAWREVFEGVDLFGPIQEREFAHSHRVDAETMRARVASVSFIATLPDDVRAKVLAEVDELLQKHHALKGRETVVMPYRTEVYWCFSHT